MLDHPFVQDHPDLQTAVTLYDKWLAKQVHDKHFPGVAVGVIHNGDLIWGRGYGYADLAAQTPITLDTRFRIASITKTFTATAILQLYDAGKLRLDDPLHTYLDWFTLQYPDAPPITIYHCLTHTSGLPRDATVPHWTENQFQDWDDIIQTVQERQPMMPPLQDYSYSNFAYSLLGKVIEAVSGQAWEAYVQQHIVQPLGMSDTIVAPKGDEAHLATGYLGYGEDYTRPDVPFIETKGFSPSASMASTINDLAKYARFHLSKGQTPLLSGYSLREMHRVHWLSADWSWGYGLGTRSWRIDGHTVTGHTGGYKGFITMFSVCRAQDTAVIALTNSIDGGAYHFVEQGYRLLLPEITRITQKSQTPDPAWQDYVGSYRNDWGDFEIVVRQAQLQVIGLDWINMPPTILEATETPDTFLIKVDGNPGELAYFMRDEAGQVVRFYSRNEYSDKA